jgi:phosphate transport system permease protein
MTDMTTNTGVDLDSRRALHRKRYRTESRFKFFGLAAIMVSVSFLVLLLITVVGSGLPAFTYNYLNLNVDLTKVEQQAPEKGDYDGAVKSAISDAMPYLSGRKGRRLARGMVSSGSSIELRRTVISNPELAGNMQSIGVPVSDFADLYLKGLTGTSELFQPATSLEVSGTEGSVEFSTSDNPVFADFLSLVKVSVGEQADRVERRIASLNRSLTFKQLTLGDLPEGEEAETLQSEIDTLQTQIADLQKELDALRVRQNTSSITETLTESMPSLMFRAGGGTMKVTEISPSSGKGEWIIPQDNTTTDNWEMQVVADPESNRKFSDREIAVMDKLRAQGLIENKWNNLFFTKGASREPELAGIWGAVVGSFFTMLITLMLSFPLGVAAAIYLEEFAPKNKLTQIIEVNINNLAAVPSIVFGLLGLAVFLNFFALPRSAPLVGGMVLALMTLPTIIIASRAALKAVPPSIREAALGVGASKLQAVFHHVLPLAMPGILTGTIIGMAQALGETAPLLMIGMVAFVVDIPAAITDPATVLPVQIYMWADFPEPGFQQKTAAAIMVLLGFLVIMNALAVFLRKRFERRW